MAIVIIECKNCHAKYKVDESKIAEKKVRAKCKKCDHEIILNNKLSSSNNNDKKYEKFIYSQNTINRFDEILKSFKNEPLKNIASKIKTSTDGDRILFDYSKEFTNKINEIIDKINSKRFDDAIDLLFSLKMNYHSYSNEASIIISEIEEKKEYQDSYDKGEKAFKENKFAQANAIFNILRRKYPENIEIQNFYQKMNGSKTEISSSTPFEKGVKAFHENRFDDAYLIFGKLRDDFPGDAEIASFYSKTVEAKKGNLSANGRSTVSVPLNENSRRYLEVGAKAFNEDRFNDARLIFQKLKRENPNNSEVDDYLLKLSYFINIENPALQEEPPRGFRNRNTNPSPLKCPICNSTSITAQKKGYSVAGGLVGAVLVGPLGLLGGAIKANKIKNLCQSCGYTWEIGK